MNEFTKKWIKTTENFQKTYGQECWKFIATGDEIRMAIRSLKIAFTMLSPESEERKRIAKLTLRLIRQLGEDER